MRRRERNKPQEPWSYHGYASQGGVIRLKEDEEPWHLHYQYAREKRIESQEKLYATLKELEAGMIRARRQDEALRAAKDELMRRKNNVKDLEADLQGARQRVAWAEADLLEAQRKVDGPVVQVKFGGVDPFGYRKSYSYAVPAEFPELEPGDFVVVPAPAYQKFEQVAVVVAVGRGSYTGPLKELVGYVVKRRGYVAG